MASEVKADKLSPSAGTTVTLGDASDTITIPTGATLNVVDGVGVASGGTGIASFTAGDVLYATGSTTLAKLAKGTAEQVLAMNSGATAPDWGSVDLTVLPTITVGKGGTNLTSFTAGDVLYATGSTTLAKLAKPGTPADEVLTFATGASAPSWVAAAGGGKMGQVVQTVLTDVATTTSGGSSDPLVFEALSGFTVDITPAATSSKVLVTVGINLCNANSGYWVEWQLWRDSTQIFLGDAAGDRARVAGGFRGDLNTLDNGTAVYLDSPSSTSAVTYFLKWACENTSTGLFNRSGGDTDNFLWPRSASSITVMEVLA